MTESELKELRSTVGQLRHLFRNMLQVGQHEMARGLLGPQIEKLERLIASNER